MESHLISAQQKKLFLHSLKEFGEDYSIKKQVLFFKVTRTDRQVRYAQCNVSVEIFFKIVNYLLMDLSSEGLNEDSVTKQHKGYLWKDIKSLIMKMR